MDITDEKKIPAVKKFLSTNRWYKVNFMALIVLTVIYKLTEYLLNINGLAFRSAVVYSVGAVIYVLIIAVLFQSARLLYRFAANKGLEQAKRVISGIGSAVISLVFAAVLVISVIYGPLFLAFSYKPEHVVEKEGKKMVAYVNSFLDVFVDYYDYVNPFVRGSQVRIDEWLGSGGYDPFEKDRMPGVKSATYYNEEGNVIKAFGR